MLKTNLISFVSNPSSDTKYFNNLVTGLDATSRNASTVTINYKQSDLSAASNSYANPIAKS